MARSQGSRSYTTRPWQKAVSRSAPSTQAKPASVAGNINVAALQILNAANTSVQGTSSGIPTVQAPSISSALSTSNATAATQQAATPNQGGGNAQPSVIIVEVLGYGGGDGQQRDKEEENDQRQRVNRQSYDPNSAFRAVGNGKLTDEQRSHLTERERDNLDRLVRQFGGH